MGQTYSRALPSSTGERDKPSKAVFRQVSKQLDRGEITPKEARDILGLTALPEQGGIPVYGMDSEKPYEYVKAPSPGLMDTSGNVTSYDAVLRSVEGQMIFGDAEFERNWTKASAGVATPYSPLEHFKQELAKAKTVFDVSTIVERELYASQLFSLYSRPTAEYQKAIDEAAQRALRAEADTKAPEVEPARVQEYNAFRSVFEEMGKGPIATKAHADALRAEAEELRFEQEQLKEEAKEELQRNLAIIEAHKVEVEHKKRERQEAQDAAKRQAEQREQDQFTSGLPWAYPDDFTAEEVESDNSTMIAELEGYRTTQSRAIMWDVVGTVMYCLAIASIFVTIVGLVAHAPWWLFVVTGLAKLAYLGSRSWLEKAGRAE